MPHLKILYGKGSMERQVVAKVKREVTLKDELKSKKVDLNLMFYGDNEEAISLIPTMKGESWKQFLASWFNKSEKES